MDRESMVGESNERGACGRGEEMGAELKSTGKALITGVGVGCADSVTGSARRISGSGESDWLCMVAVNTQSAAITVPKAR